MVAMVRLLAVVLERAPLGRVGSDRAALSSSAAFARGVSCVHRSVARVRHCLNGSRQLVA